jgi:hypothetical protein
MMNDLLATSSASPSAVVRRRVVDQPVVVDVCAGRPVRIRSHGRVTAHLCSYHLCRSGIDRQLWKVEVRLDEGRDARVYELERDQVEGWRIRAMWS